MIKQEEMLFTGGSGLLGSELKKIFPNASYPSSKEFNVTDYPGLEKYMESKAFKLLFHGAAFTSPPLVEKDPAKAIEVNISGTANIVKLCSKHGLKLVYVSTDYVFKGDKGNYKEDDPVFPVNKYAWSKLGGECAARMYDNSIIIRTTFGPSIFPYEKAFSDQWTSRESVGVIAGMIAKLIVKDATGVFHVCGKRKTVFEYAKGLDNKKDIKKISIKDMNFKIPRDTSLDCKKYKKLIERIEK
ncbi:MAG: sugar nucleotide-binding protein [Endomicrobiales bacterium]|nr:sugar nucleotide-binding protein [Endomicrobiales bacterium]